MAELTYALCALISAFCAVLLIRNYLRTKLRLALLTSVCFVGLALNNVFLCVDLLVVPNIDLSIVRGLLATGALLTLVVGLIWEGP